MNTTSPQRQHIIERLHKVSTIPDTPMRYACAIAALLQYINDEEVAKLYYTLIISHTP